jgi:hypothetical protein
MSDLIATRSVALEIKHAHWKPDRQTNMQDFPLRDYLMGFLQSTWCYNPEDSHLRTNRRENLKSYKHLAVLSLSLYMLQSGHKSVLSQFSLLIYTEW